MIDSADFSAQERKRLYWTNIPFNHDYKKSDIVLGDVLQEDVDDKLFYDANVYGIDLDKQVCGYLDINIHDMHKRVFNPKFKCHTLTCVSGGNQQKKVLVNGKCRKLSPCEYERLQTLPDNYTAGVSNTARYTAVGNGWTVDVIAHILKGIKTILHEAGWQCQEFF